MLSANLQPFCDFRAQSFMRQRKDECSFVSLRDVERMLTVLDWFQQPRNQSIVADKIFEKLLQGRPRDQAQIFSINLILALGVSYYVRLDERRVEFVDEMARCLRIQNLFFFRVITTCQGPTL